MNQMVSVLLSRPLLVIVSVAYLASGCIAKNRGTDESYDFGPQAQESDVRTALVRPLAKLDPSQIKVGEFAHWADTAELAGQIFTVTADTAQTVVDRQEDPEKILFTIVQERRTYGEKTEKVNTEYQAQVKKDGTENAATLAAEKLKTLSNGSGLYRLLADSAMFDLPNVVHNASALSTYVFAGAKARAVRVSYHNLRTAIVRRPPPEKVQARPNCDGIAECLIEVHEILYDQVFWIDGTPETVKVEYHLSADVPFLASTLNKCLTGIITLDDGRRTLLRQCSPMENFQWEPPTP